MVVQVRINGILAQEIGASNLRVQVADPATVADVLAQLNDRYPDSAEKLTQTIPFVAGQHLSTDASISPGQKLSLLMPAAGG